MFLRSVGETLICKRFAAESSTITNAARKFLSYHNDARELFDKMPCRISIASFAANGRYFDTIAAFKSGHIARVQLDSFALAAAVKSASSLTCRKMLGRSLHGVMIKLGSSAFLAVEKALIDMYAKHGAMNDSVQVFQEMGKRDAVAWNVLLSGFAWNQKLVEVLEWFSFMRQCDDEADVKPTAITVAVVLPVCAKLNSLECGWILHVYTIKIGLDFETLVTNALVAMYSKCGRTMNDARKVFDLIDYKDVVSWNSVIAGYSGKQLFAEGLGLFYEMVATNVQPNYATFATVLPICVSLELGWRYGKEIHCYLLRRGLDYDLSVCNALLTHYSKVGEMDKTEFILKGMQSKDIISWNTMLSGYATNGLLKKSLVLFQNMLSEGMKPDKVTLVTVLPVCAELLEVGEGRKIHEYVNNNSELSKETSISNALISFYGKCGKLDDALSMFMAIPRRDLISWNAMLTVYAENKCWEELIDLYNKMTKQRIRPDSVTILCLLQVCPNICIKKVKEAHGYSIRVGFFSKMTVGNATIDAYSKCGNVENASRTFRNLSMKNVISGNTMIASFLKHGSQEDAKTVFQHMNDRDLTTWNLMVQVYANNDRIDQAFNLFHELQNEGMRPNVVSLISIIVVCVRIASVHLVRQCHGYKVRALFHDIRLEGALLDAYSKCGSVSNACKLFRSCSVKDLITYTAMVAAYAIHGMAEEALMIFSEMLGQGIKPDHVILTTLLSACSHAGLIDEGYRQFNSIRDIHGIELTMEHYACMVDLLARGGRLKEAYEFILDMPCKPNANVWGTLLGACEKHGEIEVGCSIAHHLFKIDAGNIGNYVVMSNIFAQEKRWDGVEDVRRLLKAKEIKKPAGCSWIEVDRMQHTFVAGDLCHPQRPLIHHTLRSLDHQMRIPLIEAD